MPTLGQRLREEREKRGLSIEALASQTRIHAAYFEAIERDDTSSLPGGFFYRSFVRQYARLLELPESVYQPELTRSLDEEIQEASARDTALPDRQISVPRMPTGKPDPAAETRRWLLVLGALVGVIALCTGAYLLYQRWTATSPAVTTTVRDEIRDPIPAPPATPARIPPVASSEAPPPEATAAAVPSTPQPAAAAPAQPEGPVRVILRASELTWVGVWQGQKILYSDVMRAGETRGFGSEDKLRIRLGNAGGVELEWNGRVIPPPGPRGQVRTLDFWSDGYALVQPPAPKPEEQPAAPNY